MGTLEGRDGEAVAKTHSSTGSSSPQSPSVCAPLAWLGMPVLSHHWLGCPVARKNVQSKDTAASVEESGHGGMVVRSL